MKSFAGVGVLGVRCIGELGTRSLPEAPDAPGRARPACSRCSGGCQWPFELEVIVGTYLLTTLIEPR